MAWLTLLGGIGSFLTSGVPHVLDFFKDKSDQKHELEMSQLQLTRDLELQKAGFVSQEKIEDIKYQEVQNTNTLSERQAIYQHDIAIGQGASQWVINTRDLVRPFVTYGLFALLAFVEIAGFYYAISTGVKFDEAINLLWDDDQQIVWASVVSFWFGSQAFGNKKK